MESSGVKPDRVLKRFRSHKIRLMIFMFMGLGIAVWSRGLWWPGLFQSAAREALSKHDEESALKWLDWATLLAPEDGETAFLRARAFRRIGNFNRSLSAIKRAQHLLPASERLQREEWLYYARSGQLQRISRHVPELLSDPQGESEEICEALAHGCVLTQRYIEANEVIKSWMTNNPTSARPYILRAKFWILKSQFANALDDLQKAVALEPGNEDAQVELATTLQRRGKFEEAIPLYEHILNAPKVAVRAHIGLAECLQPRGEIGRIRRLLKEAVNLAPDNSKALREMGRLELETGNYAKAVKLLEEAVRISPRDDECHRVMAQALVAHGQPDKSQPHFEFAKKVSDGLRELNRCEEILSKDPRNVEAMVTAGSILLEIADQDEGVPRLLAALEIEPNHPIARKRLADHFSRRAESNPEFRKLAEHYRLPTEPQLSK